MSRGRRECFAAGAGKKRKENPLFLRTILVLTDLSFFFQQLWGNSLRSWVASLDFGYSSKNSQISEEREKKASPWVFLGRPSSTI